jgi:hypothetical protein
MQRGRRRSTTVIPMTAHPYSDRPDHAFWRQGVAEAVASGRFDPVVRPAFVLSPTDRIATAGSCFAQHLARTLVQDGYGYLVTEPYSPAPGVTDENFGIFPARFGNIYTVRQMNQLFDRAFGAFEPGDRAWPGRAGGFVDPFRPRIQSAGFPSVETLGEDRARHLSAVRRMFETADLLIFTLGLTEAWVSARDGAVVPLAPGVVAQGIAPEAFVFRNFSHDEVLSDLEGLLTRLRGANPKARLMLTVSPVPLVATFEDRHVLVSTVASKSILRSVVDAFVRRHPEVAYFPSYEIVTGPQARGRYFAEDMREVTAEGVDAVMALFRRHYLSAHAGSADTPIPPPPAADLTDEDLERMMALTEVICDEEAHAR